MHAKEATTPVALVESATLPEEKRLFTTLAALAAEALPKAAGPVVMCVGEVFREKPFSLAAERELHPTPAQPGIPFPYALRA